jgi:Aldehyde dehydrogenase family
MYENLLANVPTDLWIGGEWRKVSDGGRFDVLDPATENKIASVASATVDDAKAAVDAASAAFEGWAAKKPRDRAEILRKSYDLITRDAERLAKLITIENGKALSDSRGEVAYAAEWDVDEGTDWDRYRRAADLERHLLCGRIDRVAARPESEVCLDRKLRLDGVDRKIGGEGTKCDERLYEQAESEGSRADGYRSDNRVGRRGDHRDGAAVYISCRLDRQRSRTRWGWCASVEAVRSWWVWCSRE